MRTSPWAPSTFFPGSSLPLSWKAPEEAVDPRSPQQIRARRWARPDRPPPPTGRRGRGGGDSGRVSARKGLAPGGSGRGAGSAPPIPRRERAEGRGPAWEPRAHPDSTLPAPGARTQPPSRNSCGGDPGLLISGFKKEKTCSSPRLSFLLLGGVQSSSPGWRLNSQSSQIGAPNTVAQTEDPPSPFP